MLTFQQKLLFTVIASALSSSVFAAPQLFSLAENDANTSDTPLLRNFQQERQDYKLVKINKDVLLSRSSSFLFKFDDQSPEVEIRSSSMEKDNTGNDIWHGVSADAKDSATFSIRNGVVNGSVRLSNGSFYQLNPIEQDLYALVKVDTSNMHEHEHDDFWDETTSEKQQQFTENLQGKDNFDASEEKTKIKILYLYTNQSRYRFGTEPAGFAGWLNTELNKSYVGSETSTEFELVGVADTKIDEVSMATMRDQMEKTDNALGKFVAQKRAETRADLVTLIVERKEYCGVATGWSAYSVVNALCAVGSTWALAHEIGHNFGLKHNEDEATWPLYANGYGVPGKFRTIMSKTCSPACTRINYFADPRKNYGGIPRGTVASNDAVRFIKERRLNVAAYYPDWESQRQLNDGDLPQNQYFEISLTENATHKQIILDEIVTRPALRDWPYDISAAVNKYFPNDVIMAGGLDTNIVKPIVGTSYQNHIWLHQDKIGAYKVDVQRKTYAVVRSNKWADIMAISGGDGVPANGTVMLTIKNKTSGQALEKYYFNNDGESLTGTSWPHHLAQTINSHNSANVIAGELKDGIFNTVTGSGYRNRLWFPLDKKNDLTAEFSTLNITENPWVEQKDIFGDRFQTDLASGTTITVAVKNSSGAVVEQRSVLIPDGKDGEYLSRYGWPAYLAHEINKSMTQIRLGEKQDNGSINVVEWSQYRNFMWKKDRANQTVVVTFSK
ncbi:MAG: zinc-dependent metalloprotease family protein [Pantoea sp.]|uniref:zinc-dependent metalloprotease family protein n=1 Tax=Pantoea sp. TaxID=69393 RepID=UPI002385483F|nr:zinc-dependent metalloprotease family protein [Pantoea sp.]MDE1187498.1 zinc-dependent metalloprotease family protein [Pantoea sp.]